MGEEQEFTDFPISLHTSIDRRYDELEDEIHRRLRKLARGHTDITGAEINIEEVAEGGQERAYWYQARIALSVRPNDISAVEQADDPLKALKGALTAAERQVRRKREKLRGH